MTEVLRIGPYEKKDPRFFGEYYSENRPLYKMEQEMKDAGFHFSFEGHIQQLSGLFQNTLNILDGGCGEGTALGDLKEAISDLGREAKTTGVDTQIRHIESAERNGVDTFIVGTVQNAFRQGLLTQNGYHFVLDYHGALGDSVEKTLPIYGHVLMPGGTALLTMGGLDISYPTNSSFTRFYTIVELKELWVQMQQYKKGLKKLLEDNGLEVIMTRGSYTLLQKKPLKPKIS